MRPALVTDSNSQLPAALVKRFNVYVVAIPVVVDGNEYLEGVDLDADGFYALFADGVPEVSTSQPSPGSFVQTYQQCIDDGHEEIISVHVSEALSGTLNSARIAAAMVDATVHLVDSRTLSFGIGCCVWQAGQMIEVGGSAAQAIAAAETIAAQLFSVTALGAAMLLSASGRVEVESSGSGIDVLRSGPDGSFASVGAGVTVEQVADLMADTMHNRGDPIRVALGIADSSAMPYYQALEQRLETRNDVIEIVRYRIGPSVGAFTGLGTAGGFWYPG